MEKFFKRIKHFITNRRKIAIGIVVLVLLVFFAQSIFWQKQNKQQYQTVPVERGTLTVSLSESGQVAVTNRTAITTQASGIVDQVNVQNGDTVVAGDTIASVTLDQTGQQKQAQAWASYLSAKSTLDTANANMYSLQSTMFSKWNTYTNLAQNSTYQNTDGSPNTTNRTLPQFTTSQDDWLAAEAAYKNQQGVIAQAQAAVNNAWLSYQATSATITASVAGTVTDITVVKGMQIGGQSSTTGSPLLQTVAYTTTAGNPIIIINVSEIDAAQIQSGNRATVTFDALPGKTFTGRVAGINTTGIVNAGVTTYPTIIVLDTNDDHILPNMSATANIITDIKDDVLLVPTAALQTQGGQLTVRVLQNGVVQSVAVETGKSSDTQTEILSGLSEGEHVVVGLTSASTSNNQQNSSPFGTRGFGGLRPGGSLR